MHMGPRQKPLATMHFCLRPALLATMPCHADAPAAGTYNTYSPWHCLASRCCCGVVGLCWLGVADEEIDR